MRMMTCARNQWSAEAFSHTVATAARYEAAKLVAFGVDPTEIDIPALQTKVQIWWLEYCLPAGNA